MKRMWLLFIVMQAKEEQERWSVAIWCFVALQIPLKMQLHTMAGKDLHMEEA